MCSAILVFSVSKKIVVSFYTVFCFCGTEILPVLLSKRS